MYSSQGVFNTPRNSDHRLSLSKTLTCEKFMKKSRRKFKAEFKAQVALAAIQERETLSELAKRYKVHPVQITKWKKEFLQNASAAFEKDAVDKDGEAEKQRLYAKIGQLEVERDWLRKISKQLGLPTDFEP